ncbi:MAG: hypothetical protein LBT56_00025 [Prevotellaceae bacterium]|jgi:hypothetical protein|nr:hypothetical protein [Prevotellaceae bacterium]
MALIQSILKTEIKAAFMAQANKTENPESALNDLADKLATAIDAFVKSGIVTGTCQTPSGAGTIQGTIQ